MPSRAEAALRKRALSYPGVVEEHPWGHNAFKVNKKVFLFAGDDEDGSFGVSLKLPHTGAMALTLPFAEPTGYGLGKSGWVSARFGTKDKPPIDLLLEWLDESYRAIAPKKFVKELDGRGKKPKK